MRDSWRKSSFSGAGDCLEWRFADEGVDVRDSKHPAGPVLTFSWSEWRAFICAVEAGEAHPPRTP